MPINFLSTSRKWVWPFLFFLILAPFTPWLDIAIEQYFYGIGNDPVEHFLSFPLLDFLFDYGPLPANLLSLISMVIVFLSYIVPRLKNWRFPCLVLLLTYAMGAGLITNGILKEYWGRPRPKQVDLFGGPATFRPFYQPNFSASIPAKSFPCGHCASGFYFFALVLVGRRLRSSPLFYLGLCLSLTLGIALSLSRMSQGGHFLSDTVAAALIMWYTALAMDWLVYKGEELP